MRGMISYIKIIKSDLQEMKFIIQNMNNKIDTLESQIKQTERALRNEIKKEFGLVLDEIERVHSILDKHKTDASMHCITAF